MENSVGTVVGSVADPDTLVLKRNKFMDFFLMILGVPITVYIFMSPDLNQSQTLGLVMAGTVVYCLMVIIKGSGDLILSRDGVSVKTLTGNELYPWKDIERFDFYRHYPYKSVIPQIWIMQVPKNSEKAKRLSRHGRSYGRSYEDLIALLEEWRQKYS